MGGENLTLAPDQEVTLALLSGLGSISHVYPYFDFLEQSAKEKFSAETVERWGTRANLFEVVHQLDSKRGLWRAHGGRQRQDAPDEPTIISFLKDARFWDYWVNSNTDPEDYAEFIDALKQWSSKDGLYISQRLLSLDMLCTGHVFHGIGLHLNHSGIKKNLEALLTHVSPLVFSVSDHHPHYFKAEAAKLAQWKDDVPESVWENLAASVIGRMVTIGYFQYLGLHSPTTKEVLDSLSNLTSREYVAELAFVASLEKGKSERKEWQEILEIAGYPLPYAISCERKKMIESRLAGNKIPNFPFGNAPYHEHDMITHDLKPDEALEAFGANDEIFYSDFPGLVTSLEKGQPSKPSVTSHWLQWWKEGKFGHALSFAKQENAKFFDISALKKQLAEVLAQDLAVYFQGRGSHEARKAAWRRLVYSPLLPNEFFDPGIKAIGRQSLRGIYEARSWYQK